MSDLPDQRKSSPVEYNKLNDVQKMYVRRFERFNKTRAKSVKSYMGVVRNIGLAMVGLAVGTCILEKVTANISEKTLFCVALIWF